MQNTRITTINNETLKQEQLRKKEKKNVSRRPQQLLLPLLIHPAASSHLLLLLQKAIKVRISSAAVNLQVISFSISPSLPSLQNPSVRYRSSAAAAQHSAYKNDDYRILQHNTKLFFHPFRQMARQNINMALKKLRTITTDRPTVKK